MTTEKIIGRPDRVSRTSRQNFQDSWSAAAQFKTPPLTRSEHLRNDRHLDTVLFSVCSSAALQISAAIRRQNLESQVCCCNRCNMCNSHTEPVRGRCHCRAVTRDQRASSSTSSIDRSLELRAMVTLRKSVLGSDRPTRARVAIGRPTPSFAESGQAACPTLMLCTCLPFVW